MTYRELAGRLAELSEEDLDRRVYYYAYKPGGEELHSVNSIRRAADLFEDSNLRGSLPSDLVFLASPLPGPPDAGRALPLAELLLQFGPPTTGGHTSLGSTPEGSLGELHRVSTSATTVDVERAVWLFWAGGEDGAHRRLAVRHDDSDLWVVVMDERS